MQTRQKTITRNADRECGGSKFCRQQKKTTMITEKKVTELITSSARKTKPVGIPAKKSIDVEATMHLDTRPGYGNGNVCPPNGGCLDNKRAVGAEQCVMGTIFSPTFHIAKDVSAGTPENVDSMTNCVNNYMKDHQDSEIGGIKVGKLDHSDNGDCPSTCSLDSTRSSEESDVQDISGTMFLGKASVDASFHEEYKVTGGLSSEVSAIYLAMQNSKLECIDEPCHDPMSTDDCMEADEVDEYDDFDPYLFIRNLPDLSAVVPTFRSILLPKQTRSCPSTSLVLDLDETLVHSSLEPCDDADFTFPVNFNLRDHTVYVRCRPYLKDFLERVSSLFEIVIFTASQSIYAEQLLNVLDPKRRIFRHRVYRESCVFVDGNYLKDLSVLGRDLAHVIIIDNSPQAFGFQIDNGIPIESWFDDRSDQALLSLLPFLESLVSVDDVRPCIAKKFNLRDKITNATCPSILYNK